jgi:hypothetical protein
MFFKAFSFIKQNQRDFFVYKKLETLFGYADIFMACRGVLRVTDEIF